MRKEERKEGRKGGRQGGRKKGSEKERESGGSDWVGKGRTVGRKENRRK